MDISPSNTGRCRIEPSEEQSERAWTIGEMAREFRVSLRTLRFYEGRALLHPRRDGTARFYSGRDRLHLQMILKAKRLGFTLAEVREILARGDCEADLNLPADQVVAQIGHLERQLISVEAALAELRRVHARVTGAAA